MWGVQCGECVGSVEGMGRVWVVDYGGIWGHGESMGVFGGQFMGMGVEVMGMVGGGYG